MNTNMNNITQFPINAYTVVQTIMAVRVQFGDDPNGRSASVDSAIM